VEHAHTPYDVLVNDEELVGTSYSGVLEQALFDRDNYNLEENELMPDVVLSSPMKQDDLAPVHAGHSTIHYEFVDELERWTTFTSLPALITF
jgi:hypothetical protein